jgi:hypothetical protein
MSVVVRSRGRIRREISMPRNLAIIIAVRRRRNLILHELPTGRLLLMGTASRILPASMRSVMAA